MARGRRRFGRRGSFRGFRRGVRRSRSSSSGLSPLKIVLPAAAYGAARQYLSNLIAPVTSMIPLGNYADEVVLGGLGWYAATKGKGIIKQVGTAMLIVEAASIGHQLIGSTGMASTTSTQSNSQGAFAW